MKAIISLSGGVDSTTLLLYLIDKGYSVKCYVFDYGQKHHIEIVKAFNNVEYLKNKGYDVDIKKIDLKSVFDDSYSSLVNKNIEVTKDSYNDISMNNTVVENRNVIFSSIIYSKALSWSKSTNSDVYISLGIHKGDHTLYPDCTNESIEACKYAYSVSNWGSDKIYFINPFIDYDKYFIVKEAINLCNKMGLDFNSIYSNTNSCYNPDEYGKPCNECGTCVERKEAFKINKIKDPLN